MSKRISTPKIPQITTAILGLLSKPLILKILHIVRDLGPISVDAIARHLRPRPPLSTVSTQLGELRKHRLVKASKDGLRRLYAIDRKGFRRVTAIFRDLARSGK